MDGGAGRRDSHRIMHEAFKQDALRAWGDYGRTGLHLTLDEAHAWMAKLEAGEDAMLPSCHC